MDKLYLGDCLEVLKELPDGSVDMVLADPPYGTTDCKWDTVIPLEPLWAELKRITKQSGAIVMTATQPFTSALVISNPQMFRYVWTWKRSHVTGHANARRQPMRHLEDVLVFYRKQPTYNPQGLKRRDKPMIQKNKSSADGIYGDSLLATGGAKHTITHTNFPRQLLEFKSPLTARRLHPTQKPVALMEYLIRTYTDEGQVVLDFTMGSGTSCVAAKQTGRRYIGIEKDPKYFAIAEERVEKASRLDGQTEVA